ncbi:MAG: hypothetical protein ABJC12_00945 [Saprospiraceae bacterium]
MRFNQIKWKLMLTTLPISFLVLGVKMVLIFGFEFDGLVRFSDIGLIFTGGIFLIGFMLAGTLADYKESEKLPAEIACSLETIEDLIILAHDFNSNFDLNDQRKQINEVTVSIIRWFFSEENEKIVFGKIKGLANIALLVQNTKIGSTAARCTAEIGVLRKLFSRAIVIRRTNFLATGYALLEFVTIVLIILLLITTFENHFIAGVLVFFITHIFVYMIRLIRDIDQPFEYSAEGKSGSAEVDLFSLVDFERRAKENIKS